MKKTISPFLLFILIVACSAGKKENLPSTTIIEQAQKKVQDRPFVPSNAPTEFTSLDDSLLLTWLLYKTTEYQDGIGWVYKKEYVYEGDTGFVEVVSRDTVIGKKDTLYYFCVQGPEFYQHGHTLHNQDAAILKKQGKSWIATDTLDESFVFDPEGLTRLTAEGDYFILTSQHAGSYNGGNYEAGEWFSVIYDGRVINSLGYLSESNNGGSDRCFPPEENNEEWECDCYSETGKGSVRMDKKTGILFVEKEETSVYRSGNRCQDSSVVIEKETLACYKTYSKTILETVSRDGKKEVKANLPVRTFLQEARKALGEK